MFDDKELLTLSVAIFIHSSKFASIGTRLSGVTAWPPATAVPSPVLFSLSSSSPGVRGLSGALKDCRFRTGETAALREFTCISCRACRDLNRTDFSSLSLLKGSLFKISLLDESFGVMFARTSQVV